MASQIIAIGGGGFLTASEPGLDRYVLEQSSVSKPRTGFIATASGDSALAIVKFYARFSALNCYPAHLNFFDRTPDLEDWVGSQDVIYVGGGNTRSMLAVWRDWGLPDLFRIAMTRGTVLAGISAGAICWFESGVTDSMAGELRPLACLGFLAGSCCPHYSGDPERRPAFENFVGKGAMPAGIAVDDGAAAHFVDGKLYRVVAGRFGAGAYQVAQATHGVTCEQLTSVATVICVD